MKILQVFTLAAIAFIGLVGNVNADSILLAPDDFVGITFFKCQTRIKISMKCQSKYTIIVLQICNSTWAARE